MVHTLYTTTTVALHYYLLHTTTILLHLLHTTSETKKTKTKNEERGTNVEEEGKRKKGSATPILHPYYSNTTPVLLPLPLSTLISTLAGTQHLQHAPARPPPQGEVRFQNDKKKKEGRAQEQNVVQWKHQCCSILLSTTQHCVLCNVLYREQ
ncbi:MAG: hypothetical protein CMI56_02975 [Parcubacteria group bacterium]|nr:hypothetical protein [Parcubacteria group bacterium]